MGPTPIDAHADKDIALWKAVESNDAEQASILIEAGANINWSNPKAVVVCRCSSASP